MMAAGKQFAVERGRSDRRGFTLIEVLISMIIFAIGLIGLAAVFPVVITQQKNAMDLSSAVSAGDSAESVLSARLGNFASTIGQIADHRWHRVAAYDPGGDVEPFLRMPRVNLRGDNGGIQRNARLRISRGERGLRVKPQPSKQSPLVYDVVLPQRPLSTRSGDLFQVTITIQPPVGRVQKYTLTPAELGSTVFVTSPAFENRLDPNGPNAIEYDTGHLQFNVDESDGATVLAAVIDYTWLDPRVVSHRDRLFPSDVPKYAWDMCIRKGPSGQAQYCMWVYRFDGPVGAEFTPEIPKPEERRDQGMLRTGRLEVEFNTARKRFFVLDPPANSRESRALEAGVYFLPESGSGPVKVLRHVDGFGWELQSPATEVDRNGQTIILQGDINVIFMPLSVFIPVDQVTWKITPLLTYTKQVDL